MKKVVLLGDSIRLSYWAKVEEILKDECEILTPKSENCAYTLHSIRRARDWFRDWGVEKVDLIHWNNGIWDHHRNAEDNEPFSSPELYLTLNKRLLKQLQRYSDKLIWANSIPAGKNYVQSPRGLCALSREDWNREVALYNDLFAAYLNAKGIPVNDLYALVNSDPDGFIGGDGIHLTPAGEDAAAAQVAAHIRANLGL